VTLYTYRRFEVQQCDRQESGERVRAFPASGAATRQDVHRRQHQEEKPLEQEKPAPGRQHRR